MALRTEVGLFLLSVLTAALSRILAAEFSSWNPWIVRRIIRFAILRLPKAQRERYEEEWQSHVDEVPGEVGKIIVASGLVPAACRMALRYRSNRTPLVGIAAIDILCLQIDAAVAKMPSDKSIAGDSDLLASRSKSMRERLDRHKLSVLVARVTVSSYLLLRFTGLRVLSLEYVLALGALESEIIADFALRVIQAN